MKEVERRWVGDPVTVRTAVELARQRGQLVDERWLPAPAGELAVVVRLRPNQAPRRRAGRWWAAGLAAAGTVTVAAGWAVWQAAVWLAAHLEAIAGGIALLLGVWWALGRLGACPGVHCPGCRHG